MRLIDRFHRKEIGAAQILRACARDDRVPIKLRARFVRDAIRFSLPTRVDAVHRSLRSRVPVRETD